MVILSNTEKKASPFLKQEFLQFCAVSCDLALHFKLLNHCCGFHQWLEAQMFVCSFVCMYLLICFVYLFILFIFPHADTNPRHSNQKLINAFLQQKAGVEIWPVVIGGSLPNIGETIFHGQVCRAYCKWVTRDPQFIITPSTQPYRWNCPTDLCFPTMHHYTVPTSFTSLLVLIQWLKVSWNSLM